MQPGHVGDPPAVVTSQQRAGSDSAERSTLRGSTVDGDGDGVKTSSDLEKAGSAMRDSDREEEIKPKNKWCLFDPLNHHPPHDPPPTLDDAEEIGLASASWLSQMTFWWLQPLLVLGYKRELETTDLPKMDVTRQAAGLSELFEINFQRRLEEVRAWNRALEDGTYTPTRMERAKWELRHRLTGWGSPDGKRKIGMAMALSDTFRWQFWSAGLYKIVADVAQVTSPLVVKQIIRFVTDSYRSARGEPGYTSPAIGVGIGWAFLLLVMQLIYSVGTAQTFSRSGQCGVLARAALISSTYRRAFNMSGKARTTISNGQLVSHISTDISRIDFASQFAHFSYTALLQLLLVIIILLVQIGYSALAAVAVVAVALPLQTYAMKKLFQGRQESMRFTDARIKTISELLSGIKIIKMFAWEKPYVKKVHELRRNELRGIRKLLTIRAANQAVALSIPTLGAVVAFAAYAAAGNQQTPAEIWTSLSLLNLLRMPLMLLPNSLSVITDAYAALERLIPVFLAEELPETFLVDENADHALVVREASFEWETAAPSESVLGKGKKKSKDDIVDEKIDVAPSESPARLENISLTLPRGELLCICGPVGSGKSSLLQGLIGEMRKTTGEVVFGGTIGYCAQTAWSQNTTVRDNILFGRPFDSDRYWDCVRSACLISDLDVLPNGDQTQIGEKGITLSGGQRQRVSIARTLYFDADIVLLDDPLSALDAHVGAYIFDHVIMGALKAKTRILVTHALHVLPHADRILVMENGRIAEQGTYSELMAANSTFARLARDFGNGDAEVGDDDGATDDKSASKKTDMADAAGSGDERGAKGGKALMQVEERIVGGVAFSTYVSFLSAANGKITGPILLLTLILMAASLIMSNFSLVWWQEDRFTETESFYSGLYAALGISNAIFIFAMGLASVFLGTAASVTLHSRAIERVLRAPLSFYDTTPIGRILNRFAKDIESIDNRLNDAGRMVLATTAQIVGSIIIVAIVSQWFLIAVAVCLVIYLQTSSFYRASARAIKRHDNVLRSNLYAWFSESLAGISTIRAFAEQDRFIRGVDNFIDLENRAYILTVINQRWLQIRLDALGALLTLVVSFVAVGQRTTISPSHIGLALATILAIQQSLSMLIRQGTEVENNMSSVERLVHYGTQLEEEASGERDPPPRNWPARGAINFDRVVMSYRDDLPPVLSGISFSINPGEKVGVVGRTGAGKSTLMQVLFRTVELTSGKIEVDGLDIKTLGLTQLREKLAIIPQEALLFRGTLRSNLDPFDQFPDSVLWDALRRSWLVERTAGVEGGSVQASRFTLDTAIEDEGSNLSVGERSLVSLARALVKDSKVVALDEATASVDAETDSKIQRTIRTEFRDKTLLVIAHRIRTIISYDRILVLSNGTVDSFDTPEALYEQGGIFHGLCVQSGISREDIVQSRQGLLE